MFLSVEAEPTPAPGDQGGETTPPASATNKTSLPNKETDTGDNFSVSSKSGSLGVEEQKGMAGTSTMSVDQVQFLVKK